MNWYKQSKKEDPDYEKMEDWFQKRTSRHIELVQKYCKKISEYDDGRFGGLIERGEDHDKSKFEDPEFEPYLYISWQYKCKEDDVNWEPPEGMAERMSRATEHHVKGNRHHPEFHCEKEVGLINRDDGDKPPKEMVDATRMPELDVAEMVADWMAMSEEKGTDPKDWAKKNVNKRWKFDEKQEKLIHELIDDVWDSP